MRTKDIFIQDSLRKIREMPEVTLMQYGNKMMAYSILLAIVNGDV